MSFVEYFFKIFLQKAIRYNMLLDEQNQETQQKINNHKTIKHFNNSFTEFQFAPIHISYNYMPNAKFERIDTMLQLLRRHPEDFKF